MSQSNPTRPKRLELAEAVDLTTVRSFYDQLLLARGSDLVIDAGVVERIGGQGVQLLLSARQTWEQDGASFAIENASRACLSALAILGVTPASLNVKGAKE